MKKGFLSLLVIILVAIFAGCGNSQKTSFEPDTTSFETNVNSVEKDYDNTEKTTEANAVQKDIYKDMTYYISENFFDLEAFLKDNGFSEITYTTETKPWGSVDGGNTIEYITLPKITAKKEGLKRVLQINSATIGSKRVYPEIMLGSTPFYTSLIGYAAYGENNNDYITKAKILSTNYDDINFEYNLAANLDKIINALIDNKDISKDDMKKIAEQIVESSRK